LTIISIGIVIPSYNQGKFLEKSIKSVFDCFEDDCKLVVIDGGSSDNSIEIIKKWEKYIHYWQSEKDEGQARAINKGMEYLSHVKYVCWLNSDDEMIPENFNELIKPLEEREDIVLTFGKACIIDEKSRVISHYPTEEFKRDRFAMRCTICQPATLIRKSAWDKAGGLDNSLQMCLDYDLWWRLSSTGDFFYVNKFVASSRDHRDTKSNTGKSRHYKEMFQILKKYYGKIPLHWYLNEARDAYESSKMNRYLLKILVRLRAFKTFLEEIKKD